MLIEKIYFVLRRKLRAGTHITITEPLIERSNKQFYWGCDNDFSGENARTGGRGQQSQSQPSLAVTSLSVVQPRLHLSSVSSCV